MDLVSVDALYVGSDRGIAAGMLAAHALGGTQLSVATMIASASHGRVTDITDVPADTVVAQLDHLAETSSIDGIHLGALAGHAVAERALSFANAAQVPVVFTCGISGPSGETVLSARGIEVVADHLAVPDLLILSRIDAQLLSGGEINTLDDAQVAAQRLAKRGARAVVIRCGPLPARFFEIEGADRPDAVYNSDLYYDGDSFALFEAPHLEAPQTEGASTAFAMTVLVSIVEGKPHEDALSDAKRFVTEALRTNQSLAPDAPLQYFWHRPPTNQPRTQ